MKVLLSGSFKGGEYDKFPFYELVELPMDGKSFYGVFAQYGLDEKGLMMANMFLACENDGTVKSYHTAYVLFRRMIGD